MYTALLVHHMFNICLQYAYQMFTICVSLERMSTIYFPHVHHMLFSVCSTYVQANPVAINYKQFLLR